MAALHHPDHQAHDSSYDPTAEVARGLYLSLLGTNPGNSLGRRCGPNCPVSSINWTKAMSFCNPLSWRAALPECFDCTGSGNTLVCSLKDAYAGKGGRDLYKYKWYRLPTEAGWDYAYRKNSTRAFCYGAVTVPDGKDPNLDEVGWYKETAGVTIHPAALENSNSWGLYDMAGNVLEMTWDHHLNYPQRHGGRPDGWNIEKLADVPGWLLRIAGQAMPDRLTVCDLGEHLLRPSRFQAGQDQVAPTRIL